MCRRWRRIVSTSPPLLQNIDLVVRGKWEANGDWSNVACLRALIEWFIRIAAPHVNELCLQLAPSGVFLDEDDAPEAAVLLAAMLGRCSTLRKLSLDCCWNLAVGPWLAPLGPSLRCLEISAEEAHMKLTGSLGAWIGACLLGVGGCIYGAGCPRTLQAPLCTQGPKHRLHGCTSLPAASLSVLERLALGKQCGHLAVHPSARLPASLTYLHWGQCLVDDDEPLENEVLPRQVI